MHTIQVLDPFNSSLSWGFSNKSPCEDGVCDVYQGGSFLHSSVNLLLACLMLDHPENGKLYACSSNSLLSEGVCDERKSKSGFSVKYCSCKQKDFCNYESKLLPMLIHSTLFRMARPSRFGLWVRRKPFFHLGYRHLSYPSRFNWISSFHRKNLNCIQYLVFICFLQLSNLMTVLNSSII